MDMSSHRNLLLLGAAVAVLYWWCKTNKEGFAALASAPFDGPADDDATMVASAMPAMPAMAGSNTAIAMPTAMPAPVPVDAATAAQAASSAWQTEAKAINPFVNGGANFVDSRAMDGVDSISGWTRKNSTWDVRGAVPIKRDPSASFFGQSSRMPPPPSNNKVFCS